MRKIWLFIFFIIFGVLFFNFSLAQHCNPSVDCPNGEFVPRCCPQKGLVPCGTPCCPCTLCHFLVLLDNIIDFFIFRLVPPVALLMITIAALMFIFSMDNPETISRAKRIISSVIIGMVIIYVSYSLVGWFLVSIGLADWVENIYRDWWTNGTFTIVCD